MEGADITVLVASSGHAHIVPYARTTGGSGGKGRFKRLPLSCLSNLTVFTSLDDIVFRGQLKFNCFIIEIR